MIGKDGLPRRNHHCAPILVHERLLVRGSECRDLTEFSALGPPLCHDRGNSASGALEQFNASSDCVKVIGILTFLVFAACYAQFLRAQAFSFRTRALA